MSDLAVAYRARMAAQEEERLRRSLDEAMAEEAATSPEKTPAPPLASEKLGPPSPEKPKGKAGPVKFEGMKVAGETFKNLTLPQLGQFVFADSTEEDWE